MAVPPKTQVFTVIVVSDHSQAVRKFRVPRRWLKNLAYAGAAIALVGLLTVAHYFALLGASSENAVLKEENAQLRSQILLVQEKVAHISATLDSGRAVRREAPDAVTPAAGSRAEPRHRAGGEPESDARIPGPAPAGEANLSALPGKLSSLETEASRQEQSLRELQEYFDDQRSLLASTPSIWPTRGLGHVRLRHPHRPVHGRAEDAPGHGHRAPHGQAVYTPSDGTVVFLGSEGGYGKVLVLDHGYGVKTRYGHLSEITSTSATA